MIWGRCPGKPSHPWGSFSIPDASFYSFSYGTVPIANGVPYVAGYDMSAVRASDGAFLWRHPNADAVTVVHGVAYLYSGQTAYRSRGCMSGCADHQVVVALNATTGAQLWQRALPECTSPALAQPATST
jgi:outer membrane protein assembly factor BamB